VEEGGSPLSACNWVEEQIKSCGAAE